MATVDGDSCVAQPNAKAVVSVIQRERRHEGPHTFLHRDNDRPQALVHLNSEA
jgi:hypothetical protein